MAYRLGDLVVRITGDNADFKKKTGETKKEAEATGKSVGKSFDLMKVKTLAMGVAGTAVFVKTIGFLKDSAMAAIEAQETFGKFDAVFDDMGGAAEAAAQQFMDSFDLAEVTAKQMLSATGDLLTGMGATKDVALDMSLQVNTLAADLASFTNYSGGAEGASAALTKALLGERESVKALGIVIREEDVQNRLAAAGKDKLTGAAMLQAKAEATLQITMEQSKNAIGDYARTSDSAANTLKRAGEQTKELQVAIGTALTPSVAFLGELWGTVAGELAKVIARSNELREADKARAEGTATTDQYILSLKAEQEQLQKTIFYSKQYNQTLTGSNAEKRLAEIEQELYMRQQLLLVEGRINSAKEQQNREAQALAELEKKRIETELAEKARITDIADARKAIYDEFLAQTAALAWQVDQDLISEKEEREGIAQALREQIDSLYALYKETGDQSILTSEQMIEAIARLEEFKDSAVAGVDELGALFERVKENYASIVGELAGALGGLFTALYEKENEELEQQMQRRLEAEGLAEEDKIARLERERDAAIAAGDEVTASEKDAEARRLKITEEFEKKKAKLKYESEKAQWALTLAMTIAEGARAIQVAATASPWPFNLPSIAFATGISALQLAAVKASQPKAPAMASGGIAEPTSGGAVVRVAENNSGEVMFNTGETGQAFIQQMGAAIAANMEITAILQTESEKLAEIVVRPINDGRVRLVR